MQKKRVHIHYLTQTIHISCLKYLNLCVNLREASTFAFVTHFIISQVWWLNTIFLLISYVDRKTFRSKIVLTFFFGGGDIWPTNVFLSENDRWVRISLSSSRILTLEGPNSRWRPKGPLNNWSSFFDVI